MKRHFNAVTGLRWTLGLVMLLQSAHFALSPSAAEHLAGTGLPHWIRPALGWVEVAAAILFLIPAASPAGGYALLLTFAAAAAIHVDARDYGIGSLIVYAAAVVVCITAAPEEPGSRPYEPQRP